jgi:hypothetical protein
MELQIWNGELLHPNLCKYYRDLWIKEFHDRTGIPPSILIQSPTIIKLTVLRPNRCEHLEKRKEFKTGCRGWRCAHACEKSLPAVPGVYCQTCTEYVDSGEPFYSGGS